MQQNPLERRSAEEEKEVGVTETLRRSPYLHLQIKLTLLKTSCDSED